MFTARLYRRDPDFDWIREDLPVGSAKGIAMVIDVGYGPMVVAHPDDLVELASVMQAEGLAVLECPICKLTTDTPAGLSMHRDGVGQPCGPVTVTARSELAGCECGDLFKTQEARDTHADTCSLANAVDALAPNRPPSAAVKVQCRDGCNWGVYVAADEALRCSGCRRLPVACKDACTMPLSVDTTAARMDEDPECPGCPRGHHYNLSHDPACDCRCNHCLKATGQAPECDCSGCDCGMECKPECASQQAPTNPGPKALYKDGHGNWLCADCHALKDACVCWMEDPDEDAATLADLTDTGTHVCPDAPGECVCPPSVTTAPETWTCDLCGETFDSDTAYQDHQQDHDYCMVCGVQGPCAQHDPPPHEEGCKVCPDPNAHLPEPQREDARAMGGR